jgi:hypothetical protein
MAGLIAPQLRAYFDFCDLFLAALPAPEGKSV